MSLFRTFAVIGSNCFTGCHIVDGLLQVSPERVWGISRSPEYNPLFLPYKTRAKTTFEFHQLDLVRDAEKVIEFLDQTQPECVINVAALSEVGLSNFHPVEYFQVNTLAVVSLCNQLRTRHYLKRYVHISSAEVYGSCAHPVLESQPVNPSTPYAASKAAADLYLLTMAKNFNFPVSLIRSTNVYGKHQQLFKIIPRTVIHLKKGERIELHGGGRAVKTWVHVRDVVDGVLRVIKADGGSGEIWHFSDEGVLTVIQVVRAVCEMMGRDFEASTTTVPERIGQDSRYELDYSKAKQQLGWRPEVKFSDGVAEVISWVEDNWSEILKHPFVYVHKV